MVYLSEAFEKKSKTSKKEDEEITRDDLLKEIGQLKVENEFLKKKVQATVRVDKDMIEPKNKYLSIKKQCDILGVARSSYYYRPQRESGICDAEYHKELGMAYLKYPIYGYRRMNQYLLEKGFDSSEKKARNAMKSPGLQAIYPKPKLSIRNADHKIYPYLLRGLEIDRINQVWAADITYLKHKGSFMYLVAIIDVYSRKVLSWRLSNTMYSYFCCECLSEAISFFGIPEIFNTDQGGQFTGDDFTEILEKFKIDISNDGKGRALDNVYIERLWRTLKYENIFLHDYESILELKKGIDRYFKFYNSERFHQSLNYKTPDDIYWVNTKSVSSF